MDKVLLSKLVDLRENIKNESFKNKLKKKQNRVVVCNDDVLHSIVSLMPEKVSDFKKIRGIGEAFVGKYAQRFLDVVNDHIKTVYSYSRTNNKELEILQKLNNKLVNINQKNRLLYANRLTNKTAFDLTRLGNANKILDAFINENGKKQFVIAKVNYDKENNLKAVEEYHAIKTLYREVEKVRIEKGQEVLYLAYPYVEGRLFSDFKIKAPLMLFPAQIEVVNNEYRLSFDKSRDILYNSTLIIASNKFNNKNEVIVDDVVEEMSKEYYIDHAVQYFKKYNVSIKNKKLKSVEEFFATTNLTFPTYDNQDALELKPYCVLGAYPTYSNAIQRDYNEIIDNKVISRLVRDLFVGIDNPTPQVSEVSQQDPNENNLFYINEMNYSQEKVLASIDRAMVIQGPPGTGKSQTITSLISQAVLQNKKVLVVSEKKTALDVIYNRLGKISDFVLYVDDPNNKDLFYKQLNSLLELDDEFVVNRNKINEKSVEINRELEKLSDLESLLDSNTLLKASLRDLYQNSRKLNFNDGDIERLFKEVKGKRIRNTFSLEQLLKLRQMFKESQVSVNLLAYKNYVKYESVYAYFKNDINETDLHVTTKDFYEIPFYVELYKKFGWYTQLRLNNKNKALLSTIKSLTEKIGGKQKKKVKKVMYDDVQFFMNAIEAYPKYVFNKNVYDSLNLVEKKYFEYCFYLSKKLKINFKKVNEYLIDIFTTVVILEFEQKYDNILITTERYRDIRDKITSLSIEKEKLTFECLYNILQQHISEVFNEQSKRLNELKRKCDSKRKWSIPKLVKEFNLELFNSIYVWLLTPEGISEIMPMKESLFDLIIFDEASQMFIENAVPILYRGQKAIVAGDSKQLRPSKFGLGRIDSEDQENYDEYSGVLEEESLLDLAKHRYHEVMLNYHYRSKYEELIAFSNYAFYNGKLHVCPNPELSTERPIERIKVNGHWVNRSNEVEADEIITLLKKIFSEGKNETVGIITFNSTQKDLILDKIEQECLYNPEFYQFIASEKLKPAKDQLFVKNIENVQGDERDIIIFSIGYAPNEQNRIVRQFGWLNNAGGENRLNVAISRAKKKIYVVTSIEPFELHVNDLKNRGPKLLREYLEYVKAISERDNDTAQKILYRLSEHIEIDSKENTQLFEQSVYDELVNIGFDIERNVGTGVHKINFVIKDKISNRYLLGIELDTSKMASIKERDYHRQKYLESHGWIVHRIWASDWWRDSEAEINKILALMNRIEKAL
ncbi:HRDC domain-containing protein [Mycoplasmatota bacterium]|nr:HRDC domain-containing protein [Mycoplasmatota bacterium]